MIKQYPFGSLSFTIGRASGILRAKILFWISVSDWQSMDYHIDSIIDVAIDLEANMVLK